eukprot:765801-Hanusia_phi.AAC.2
MKKISKSPAVIQQAIDIGSKLLKKDRTSKSTYDKVVKSGTGEGKVLARSSLTEFEEELCLDSIESALPVRSIVSLSSGIILPWRLFTADVLL